MADIAELERRIRQGRGLEPADLVIKHARIVDVATGSLGEGDVAITGDTIVGVADAYEGREVINAGGRFVAPGFIDTHVHVESSMVAPAEFERLVLPRGTTTAVCDPHELANVLGMAGIEWMLDEAAALTMTLKVNLSSCVPASHLETSGAAIEAADLEPWRDHQGVIGLAEVMSFPAVLAAAPLMLAKLRAFQGRHIDGHAPLLSGRDLSAYIATGIRTEHECTTVEEAREKMGKGLAILMREGSVAKNVTTLAPLLREVSSPRIAFCTDDRNPSEVLAEGHIDHALRLAIRAGAPVMAAYRSATLSAGEIMGLRDRGLVAPGYRADLVLLDDLEEVRVSAVLCGGRPYQGARGRREQTGFGRGSVKRAPVTTADLDDGAHGDVPTIGVRPFSLLTDRLTRDAAAPAVRRLAIIERHGRDGHISHGHVEGFGPLHGALALSVGHDSHNVGVLGSNPADMAHAANRLIELDGGAVAVQDGRIMAELALPIAGLMSDGTYEEVASGLDALGSALREMGATLAEPLLHMAFLQLVVIPHLKLSDRGLVDVDRFAFLEA